MASAKQQHSLHHVQLILNSRAESGLLTDVCDRIQQSEYQVEEPNSESWGERKETG